jgi:hypothetical protein
MMKCELDLEIVGGELVGDRASLVWSELPSEALRSKLERLLLTFVSRIDHYGFIDPEVHGEEERELVRAMGNLTLFHVSVNEDEGVVTK